MANKETQIWLPYGNRREAYFDVAGFDLTDPEPMAAPCIISHEATVPAHLTLKFHFDEAISAFRFAAGATEFHPKNAVAGVEYSVDGQKWTTVHEISADGNNVELVSPKQKITGLKTQDLYIRVYTRDKDEPDAAKSQGAWLKVRNGGDVAWGDASYTFFQAQWQLWVTPAE